MKVRRELWLLACVSAGLVGVAVVSNRDSTLNGAPQVEALSKQPGARGATLRTSGPEYQRESSTPSAVSKQLDGPRQQPERRVREVEDSEPGESPLTHEWDEMTAEQRSTAALDEFHRSMRAVVDTRSKHDLEHAAVMLSVLRGELFATDVGRAQYTELEAQYDDAAQQLSDAE